MCASAAAAVVVRKGLLAGSRWGSGLGGGRLFLSRSRWDRPCV